MNYSEDLENINKRKNFNEEQENLEEISVNENDKKSLFGKKIINLLVLEEILYLIILQ